MCAREDEWMRRKEGEREGGGGRGREGEGGGGREGGNTCVRCM